MKRELTCIVCPLGCKMEVELKDDEILSVTGNTCKRGSNYAIEECTHPTRMLTTTVVCADSTVVPVKTASPIPKEMLFPCMEELNKIEIPLPIKIGDVVIENILGTGVNIIATANKE